MKEGGFVLFRVIAGIIFVLHGWAKFNGGFAIGFFTKIGMPIPAVSGPFITALEICGGVALILGLLTRYLGILYTIQMCVAAYVQWILFKKGFSGAELEMLLVFTGILLATNGAGKYSLDKMLKLE